jgi:glutathione S-transferase
VYVARRFDGEPWLPTDPASMALVMQWLMVAENEIARGPGDARLHDKFGVRLDVALARERAGHVLTIMDRHLSGKQWLVLDGPTIADIACMPYVALGWEGGVILEPYPAIVSWVERIKKLSGFIGMPGI